MELSIYHWLLIAAFVAIVIWVFGRKRKARFEGDARIPFEEDKD
ncbi:MAG: CcoQ/FixQ family Cbb3-type cytochrome c oxidase assembly chaperone [Candidatus Accumulibacter sp.]|nr:CcoQ/FixQ family Cbb3-type cytochrome c oxidase assembly chaperone [Accumulibacter sp.]MBE2257502.1 CcoQ/FixQ family Cbb3-type cytochrome c oxidase assembly chaperone [Paracoccaceae bacterium]MCB1943938.1 CcoQ/FixQ family Cbb3-type cytochrome c oxidase assembly chaperone [Accumulibacter sp.]MCP5249261.1 CcoQ/FixQ family Cbb3-type cytochrome c oxidase assembly chaperone [Accumulibacter sp.]